MSNSLRSNHSWTVVVASLICWVTLLSSGLRFFFGAEVTGDWLLAGTMMSIAAFCILLVVKEILDSILTSRLYACCQNFLTPQTDHKSHLRSRSVSWQSTGNLLDSSFSGTRRAVLGLRSHEISSNRRRKQVKVRASSSSGGRLSGRPAY